MFSHLYQYCATTEQKKLSIERNPSPAKNETLKILQSIYFLRSRHRQLNDCKAISLTSYQTLLIEKRKRAHQ